MCGHNATYHQSNSGCCIWCIEKRLKELSLKDKDIKDFFEKVGSCMNGSISKIMWCIEKRLKKIEDKNQEIKPVTQITTQVSNIEDQL